MASQPRIRTVLRAILVILACVGSLELPGIVYPLVWRALGVRTKPFASAYYNLRIANSTGQEMAFEAILVNDRRFEPASEALERFNLRLGWRWNKDVIISDGDSMTIILPSPVDPRLGIVLVIGRTPLVTSGPLRQGLCMRFLTWPWSKGRHQWRQKGGDWPLLTCSFRAEDVVWLDGNNADDDGPIVPILKRVISDEAYHLLEYRK